MQKLISILFILSLYSCASIVNPSYDKELSEFQYPFQVYTYTLMSQRQVLKMRFMDINKESKKVVVLLHGKNFSGFYWEKIAKELSSKGYRVIIPDQIGFGKSSKPENYQYNFANLALNTYELLHSLKIQNYTLVGHSMGGMLAIHMSTMYQKNINKLVLINPIGLEDYLQYVEYKDPAFFYKNEKYKTVEMFRDYQIKNYYDGKWDPEYEKLIQPFKGWKNGNDWDVLAWNNALTYSPIFTDEVVSKMALIKIPTYLIIGTRDATGPGRAWKKAGVTHKLGEYKKLGKATQKRIKNSKLYELEGLGHMPQFENYKLFSKSFYPIFK